MQEPVPFVNYKFQKCFANGILTELHKIRPLRIYRTENICNLDLRGKMQRANSISLKYYYKL